jgi:hyperosmotically inducible periplasmic protein
MKNLQGVALILTLSVSGAAATGGCRTTQSAGKQVDDAGIKIAVKAKLAKDVRFSTLTNIEVNSTNGAVTLAGQVKTEKDRVDAGEIARSVEGVVKVNNELQVEKR